MTLKKNFIAFKMDIFSMKIYMDVMDVANDVTHSRKSVITRVVVTFLIQDVINRKTATS